MTELELLKNDNSYTNAIELIVVDKFKKERRSLVLFNLDDGWGECENFTESDIESLFAGQIMQVAKKDQSVVAYKATSYTIQNNSLKKSITFTPVLKKMNVTEDGSIVFM